MSDADTSEVRRRRKRWPEALKREIVAATFAPGASVSVVARQYDVNANQVFSWRRRYRDVTEQQGARVSPSLPELVPVTITPTPEVEQATPPEPAVSDTIEIAVPDGIRVRVGSGFDGRALRRVLDVLRKR
ncbi:MAG: transposase [Hyphomicrobiales bacterium]|nr:transposase [Hyphomicrobiales bacterium]